ncbi:restriction endonuclease subunit S [Luteimicrobium subarcticum]|uniref:Type I restriction modification DNA specificity protein n=1 Tax=Luteimicrobium subarcticum TaxID=620910 RepID=A0A2M8W6Y3_9MICO|nr:restriction endonuclease subunit S [Luteimicrobium subarcticum]PJI86654.1 type I restriction modification DNA specificity protein [Luteimicrobium subarcticum]
MSDLGTLYGGLTGKSKADFTGGSAPFITYMNVFSNLATDLDADALVEVGPNERQTAVAYGDVLFTASSESREEVGMASAVVREPSRPTYLNSFCFGFRPNSTADLDPEFAKHLFRAPVMRDQIVKTANGVTRINISKAPFGKMAVPLPDVEEQKHIAAVLDQFDALVNDLSSGLPAEIAARRQQYAHYRDTLLSFKEAA